MGRKRRRKSATSEKGRQTKRTKYLEKEQKPGKEFKDLKPGTARKRFRSEFIPFLEKIFGSFECFMEFMSHCNKYRKWKSKSDEKMKKKILKKSSEKFSSLQGDSMKFVLNSYMPLIQWKRESDWWSKETSKITGRKRSRRLCGTVIMKKLSAFRTWDCILSQMSCYISSYCRFLPEKQGWRGHGSYVMCNVYKLLIDHLQDIWKRDFFLDEFLNDADKNNWEFLLSMSVDGTRLGKSESSCCISFVWRVVFERSKFKPESIVFVTMPVPWMIANDVEKIETMEFYEGIFVSMNRTMRYSWKICYQPKKGFFEWDPSQKIEDSMKFISFKFFCFNGDAKIQQIRTGSSMGNGRFRCPHCLVGSSNWNKVEFFQFHSRTLGSHFLYSRIESKNQTTSIQSTGSMKLMKKHSTICGRRFLQGLVFHPC